MTVLFDWPRATEFGHVIPKSRIFANARVSKSLRKRFAQEVNKIIWSHKLAPVTTNLATSRNAPEIQIIGITLRTGVLHQDILRAVDRAIPFPLIFELRRGDQIKVVAAHKRPSGKANAKWPISAYFESEWLDEHTERVPLPVALDMGGLYERLLTPLVDDQLASLTEAILPSLVQCARDTPQTVYTSARPANTSPLVDRIASAEAVRAKMRDINRTKARLKREKQFNKRVEINTTLRAALQELQQLTANSPDAAMMD